MELPELDFAGDAYASAPFETLATWAQRWSMARSVRGVEILDYDLCRRAIIDRRLGTGHPKLMHLLGLPEGRPLEYKRNSISFYNRGDRRRDLRRPLSKLMSESGVEGFRADIKATVQRVIDAAPTDRPVDLIEALCDPIPSAVYCYWIGAPFEDAGFVARTSHTVQKVHTRNPKHTPAIVTAFEALIDYADKHIAARRAKLGDDLLSDMIRAEEAGQLDRDDLRNWVIKLAEANTDNSSHQIALAIYELASRPEVWARLHADPELVPQAVREVMRYHPRTISTSREVMEDCEIGGVDLPAGTPIFANIGATHWDARYYRDPARFDIDRTNEPPHQNFGGGVFSCIGRFAVTAEVEEVVRLLSTRHPDLRIEDVAFAHSPMFSLVTQLSARLAP
jgi:cytochrome P450